METWPGASYPLGATFDGNGTNFAIFSEEFSPKWDVVVDTAGVRADSDPIEPGSTLRLEAKSMLVLRDHTEPEPGVDHSVAASVAQSGNGREPAPPPKSELRA